MTTDVDEFLEHAGVKGMKWGKRKASTTPSGDNSYRALVKRSTVSKLNKENALNKRLTTGKGSGMDVLRAIGRTSILELAVNKGSYQKAAANRLKTGTDTVNRILSGNATKADKALAVQNTSALDLIRARE